MVEFAIGSMVFLLLVSGIIDFGHAFYMKQVVTNASREGARYGIVYRTDTNGKRIAPANLSPTIQNYLLNGYLSRAFLPSDANPQVNATGAGYSSGVKGADLEVRVSAIKTWFIVSRFIPSLSDQITLTAATVMQCE